MRISVIGNGKKVIFDLNDSQAAKDLYEQLPLKTEVKNFSTNEKIFYPPSKLNSQQAPKANAKKGTMCYYSPWGNVVMFYEHFGKGSSLYELGQAVTGENLIESLSGVIEITKVEK